MKKSAKNLTFSIVFAILFIIFSITIGISFILFFRSFFYSQINYLYLPYYTGYNYLELKESYDVLMNFLLFNDPFSEGVFKYSEEGKAHFVDCQPLFLLNNILFIVSSIGLCSLTFLRKKGVYQTTKFKGLSITSWSVLVTYLFLIVIVIACAIDFYEAFRIFHMIFFPGKTNFVLNSETDPIINMFQEAFFINCALLIGIVFIVLTLIPLIKDFIDIKRNKKLKKQNSQITNN